MCVCVFQVEEEKWANGNNGRELNLHCAMLHGSLERCNCKKRDNVLCVEGRIVMRWVCVDVHAYALKRDSVHVYGTRRFAA